MRLWSFQLPPGAALVLYDASNAVQSNSDIENAFGGGVIQQCTGVLVG